MVIKDTPSPNLFLSLIYFLSFVNWISHFFRGSLHAQSFLEINGFAIHLCFNEGPNYQTFECMDRFSPLFTHIYHIYFILINMTYFWQT
jgi:hypothetical protein